MSLPFVKNYIDGEFVDSNSELVGDVWNPAAGEKIARVRYSTAAEVDQAVQAAKAAYPEWRATPPLSRARYLFRLKDLYEESFEEIAAVLTIEHGKAIDEARGEVRRAIENIEHATGVTTMMTGYCLEDIAHGMDCTTERQPMGVFAAIAPFNFPCMVPYWFLPYALVTGNCFILKPSEQVPMTQTKMFEIIDELGLPDGVVQMVHGSKDVVNALLDHPDIEGVSFVGSTPTARYIYERCGATGKRCQSLGGAKNSIVIMPDAQLDAAIPSLITSFYGCTGQRCLSGANLVAVGDVYDELKEKFVAAAKKVTVGDGLEPLNQMGPVISAAAKARIEGMIQTGIDEGAKLILDGRGVKAPGKENGFFIGPCIFDGVTKEMTIAKTEIFGPVANIIRVKDLDEAIELTNTRGMANAACLYTQSGATLRKFKYEALPSMIGVNIGIAAPMAFFPFGGAGQSMFGDIKGHGREIFNFFTDAKCVITRW